MLMTNKNFVLIIVAIFIAMLSACDNSPRVHESWVPPPEDIVYDDNVVAAKIKSTFMSDRELQGTKVDVKVHEGQAILEGEVNTEDQMTRINVHTWTVEGVKGVVNNIVLKGK